MRLFIVILTAFLCGLVASLDTNTNSKDGTIFLDGSQVDVTTINANEKKQSKDSETSGDEEDGSGDVQGDSSGDSGSGDILPTTGRTVAPTTTEENVVILKTVPVKKVATAKSNTEHVTVTTKATEVMTEEVREIVATTIVPIDTTKPTTDDNMFGGGIGGKTDSPPEGNVEARKQERDALRVLSKEVIAAVVIGGICAIILIAFLVYRLRKRDEGSYVLTDSAYKDTNKLRGDPGKEAFV